MAELSHIGSADFDATVLKGKLVLVDFYAEWCGPCSAFSPVLEQLAAEMGSKLSVVKVNVDENLELAQKYGVRGIPSFCLFKNGEIVADDSGYKPIEFMREFVKPHI